MRKEFNLYDVCFQTEEFNEFSKPGAFVTEREEKGKRGSAKRIASE